MLVWVCPKCGAKHPWLEWKKELILHCGCGFRGINPETKNNTKRGG